MPSTTNFGWTTPADTDYVKDGASAIRTLAGGIDTSMAQLKGGTAGQILSKTNGTDMAFTWINNDQGDITGVTAGTGLSGGGTSGAVTLSIDTATTVDKTTAQTLTNKTLTSPIISSISNTGTLTLPTSTDTLVGRATTDTLTNKTISASSNTLTGVINNTLTTTTGDLIYASSANTPARLAIGSSNQVLTVSGGVPTWATPAVSSSGLTFINRTTFSNVAGQNIDSIFSSTYKSYIVVFEYFYSGDGTDDIYLQMRAGSTTITSGYYGCAMRINSAGSQTNYASSNTSSFYLSDRSGTSTNPSSYSLHFQKVGNAAEKPMWHGTGTNIETFGTQIAGGGLDSTANTITGIRVSAATTNIYGIITTYGLATA
jgi:hypothetical protein